MKLILKKLILFFAIPISIILIIYLLIINASIINYYYSKFTLPTDKLIEKYARIQLPDEVIIKEANFYNTDGLSEYLQAKIILDEKSVEKLLDEYNKNSDFHDSVAFVYANAFGFTENEFDYMVWVPSYVYKCNINPFNFISRGQRDVRYLVLKPIEGETTICVFISHLGWW